jgi:endonuclease/exonuclease/phosphatase family metal-dependent hydrolase
MNWHLHSHAKGLIVSGVLILALIGLPMGFALNRTGDEMKQDVSIMTCNIGEIVGSKPLDSDEVAAFIRDCGVPDVLLLQEVRGEKEAAYLSRQLNRPGFVFLPDHDSDQLTQMGIAILSGLPVLGHDILYFTDSRRGAGAVAVEIDMHGTRVWVVNVHLDRVGFVTPGNDRVPVSRDLMVRFVKKELMGESARSRSVKELMAWLDKKNPDHVVLGGDFNTIPFSKTVRQLCPGFDDVLWPSLDYFKGTYTKLDFPIAPRIDFLFVSAALGRKNARVIPKSPGDHFPVRADILIPGQG